MFDSSSSVSLLDEERIAIFPKQGDFVIGNVHTVGGKTKKFVGKLLSGPDEEEDFEISFLQRSNKVKNGFVFPEQEQRWKPVGRPVGSRFFDRPVKPVEKPIEFSFLATKRRLSTNRNILRYFLIAKTFDQKTVLTNHIFWKHLLNGFKLWLICCNH